MSLQKHRFKTMQKKNQHHTHTRFEFTEFSCFLLSAINKERDGKLPPSQLQGKTTPRGVHDYDSGWNGQQKTYLPRQRRISKEHPNMSTLRSHVVGTIVHSGLPSHRKDIFTCLDLFEWPHYPNLTISVICVLDSWNHYRLVTVLYLQLDNCPRENKTNVASCFLTFTNGF